MADPIQQPIRVIRQLYAASSAGHGAGEDTRAHYARLITDPAFWSKIPILTEETAERIPNETLVRYRGLVQDMPNSEYYVGEYQRADGSWQTTKYCDQLDEALPPGGETRIAERKPLLLVPVPGETGWVRSQEAAAAEASVAGLAAGAAQPGSAAAAAKRGREEDDVIHDASMDDDVSMGVSEATGATGQHPGGGMACCPNGSAAAAAAGEDTAASRARLDGPAGASSAGAAASSAAAPQEGVDELPPGSCMVYVYDDEGGDLKLNDVVEVVGVLSRVPELAAAHMQHPGDGEGALSMMMEDVLSSHLPTSRVPRLHTLLASAQRDPYAPPFASPAALAGPTAPAPAAAPGSGSTLPTAATSAAAGAGAGGAAGAVLEKGALKEARGRAIGFLSMVLGGDDLAAEYLLLQLVSRVHLRSAESAVGVVPLNLTACPAATLAAASGAQQAQRGTAGSNGLSPFGASLAAALEALAPRALALPLTIDELNRRPWWPRRHQNTQRLIPAPLQLPSGCQLLLDETVMQSGTLNEVGLRNLGALAQLLKSQKVSYDFEFFSLDQPAEAPATVLSLGRSLLKEAGGLVVPLRPAAPLGDPASVAAACASADLVPVRAYLAAARSQDFAIDQATGAWLEQELAAARQRSPSAAQETMHAWLNVARLVAVSFGESSLTREHWEHAMALERRRQERLPPPAAAAPSGAK